MLHVVYYFLIFLLVFFFFNFFLSTTNTSILVYGYHSIIITLRSITSVGVNFPSILHQKNYFFYFTYSFLQNTHINLSILHIYSIKYSFFYNFLLFSPSSLFSHKPNPKGPKPISLKTTLSLINPNQHHTNHQILALTKHLFITLFITSFITSFIASSLQWVPKVDPPLLRLRRLIGASYSSRRSRHRQRRRHVLRPNPTRILESRRWQSKSM